MVLFYFGRGLWPDLPLGQTGDRRPGRSRTPLYLREHICRRLSDSFLLFAADHFSLWIQPALSARLLRGRKPDPAPSDLFGFAHRLSPAFRLIIIFGPETPGGRFWLVLFFGFDRSGDHVDGPWNICRSLRVSSFAWNLFDRRLGRRLVF